MADSRFSGKSVGGSPVRNSPQHPTNCVSAHDLLLATALMWANGMRFRSLCPLSAKCLNWPTKCLQRWIDEQRSVPDILSGLGCQFQAAKTMLPGKESM